MGDRCFRYVFCKQDKGSVEKAVPIWNKLSSLSQEGKILRDRCKMHSDITSSFAPENRGISVRF